MNRFCYRVIFSKSLGRLVVVSEKTRSQGKSDNLSTVSSAPSTTSLFGLGLGFGLKTLTLSLLLGLGLIAHANPTTIIADPSADNHYNRLFCLPPVASFLSISKHPMPMVYLTIITASLMWVVQALY